MLVLLTLASFLSPSEAQTDNTTSSESDSVQSSQLKLETQESKPFIIDSEIKYKAKDSIYTDLKTKKTYLYGEAEVSYQDILLTAHTIILDNDSNTAMAYGTVDTLGNEIGLPIFTDPSGEYTMRSMKYNFETEKAIIEHIITQQGEGFVVGQKAKKIEDDAYCMANAKYSTCDNHDHPHFYLNLTKAKVIPGKKTVTGPAYLVIEDVKIPFIGLPFAIIPSTSKYSSGFLFPSYRDEQTRGFGLSDGGYYWAASNYFDAMIRSDIYTNGSWAARFASNYKVRYKFGGNINMQYLTNIVGEEDLPNYRKTKDMSVTWSHRQDSKANPLRSFSANVNYSTSSFDQNNINNLYNGSTSNLSRNTKRSSISYSRRWAGLPINFSSSFLHSQNSRDSTIDLTLPDFTFTMSRIYPFKNKNKVGTKENIFEKISLQYTGTAKNYIHTKERDLSIGTSSLQEDWKNGVKHSIPIDMNIKFLRYFTVTPNFNYTERWYFKKVEKDYDYEEGKIIDSKTSYGLNRVYDYSMGAGTSTKIYTYFRPWRKLFGDKVNAIRHVATPSVGFNYSPDFSQNKFGFYDEIEYYDEKSEEIKTHKYSFYDDGIYGKPGSSTVGSLNFSLGNTLDMKVKSDRDTTGFKKIKILDRLNFGSGYNFLADSLNLSKISMNGSTKLFGTNINFGANFDPYALDTTKTGQPITVNKYMLNEHKKIARLTDANLSFSLRFDSKKFKRKKEKGSKDEDLEDEAIEDEFNNLEDPLNPNKFDPQKEFANNETEIKKDDEGYAKFSIPWNISLSYSFRYVKDKFNPVKMDYDFKMTSNVNINGRISITPKWNINFSSGYNFDLKEIGHTNIGISRDLHCWSMNFNLVPIGRYKSYFFTIRVNSSMLQDLKWEQRNHPRDNPGFYN